MYHIVVYTFDILYSLDTTQIFCISIIKDVSV